MIRLLRNYCNTIADNIKCQYIYLSHDFSFPLNESNKVYLMEKFIRNNDSVMYIQMFSLNLHPHSLSETSLQHIFSHAPFDEILLFVSYYHIDINTYLVYLLDNPNISEQLLLDMFDTLYSFDTLLQFCVMRDYTRLFNLILYRQPFKISTNVLISAIKYKRPFMIERLMPLFSFWQLDQIFNHLCSTTNEFYADFFCKRFPQRYSYTVTHTEIKKTKVRKRNRRRVHFTTKAMIKEFHPNINNELSAKITNIETECPICFEIKPNSITNCKHQFCDKCINRCSSCPLCRNTNLVIYRIIS